MDDDLPDEISELILLETHLLAAPSAPVEAPPEAAGYLTRESLDSAFAQLFQGPELRLDPMRVQAELALARWLDAQPPGTAERLLRHLFGEPDARVITHPMVGRQLTSADPEPPVGSVVVDDCGLTWENDGYRPCCWVRPGLRAQDIHDPETWTKIAGNYGPVTVQQWGEEEP